MLVQATVWDINPFDQWASSRQDSGKVVEADLTAESGRSGHDDSSTTALIDDARAALKR